ncbi:MAG: 2-oxo acid dehydrogenase subunit E2 [Clostridia bacterium]|nr:2-oxo acid dehydrogenase subunit E2 [Clostridia bacterium]
MATPVLMPNVGISVESCILTEWHKKKGEEVKEGEILFTYETDKTTTDEPAPASGTLIDVFFEEGAEIPIMTNIAVIGNPGESTKEFLPDMLKGADAPKAEAPAPAAEAPKAEAPAAAPAPAAEAAPVKAPEGEVFASPRAKALAKKAGVDYRFATPTGAEGRVCEADVRRLIENGPSATYTAAGAFAGEAGSGIGGKFSVADIDKPAAPAAAAPAKAEEKAEYVDEKMSGVRRAIAKNMLNSLATTAQLTNTSSFDATEIMAFRAKLKANAETLGLPNITLNDIILYAVSRILAKPEHANLNAHLLEGDVLRKFSGVHLGVAVDTEKGLLVPTIMNADKKTLAEISKEAKELAKAAQAGTLAPDKMKGASFTISNLGSFGIESFTPVINPPQTGILGVNTITTRVKVVNGEMKPYQAMALSLTYDHRAVDGAPASRFLKDLCTALENFSLLLCK